MKNQSDSAVICPWNTYSRDRTSVENFNTLFLDDNENSYLHYCIYSQQCVFQIMRYFKP